jgi:ABC-2 type transport system permease protein
MFTIDASGIQSMYMVVAELFMGSIVPLPFLPKILITLGNFLPFRFMSDFPYRVYSNDIPLKEGLPLLLLSLAWVIITILIGLLLSKKALKKAVIQGG